MSCATIWEAALNALILTVEDANSYPNITNASKVRKIGTQCLIELKNDECGDTTFVNRIKSVMLLNRMVIRTISDEAFTKLDLEKDLRSLKNTVTKADFNLPDKAAVLEISSFFSSAARDYCVSEKLSVDPKSANSELSHLMTLCAENADPLVRRSITSEHRAS
jgi:hypothetical protein